MACNPKTEGSTLTAELNTSGFRSRAAFGLLVGVGGLVMVGVLGGVIGCLGGLAAMRNARAVLLAAGIALLVAVALTVLEQPLSGGAIYDFPRDHSLANIAAAIAAVLLLAGLVGMAALPDRAPGSQLAPEGLDRTAPRAATSTIAATLIASLLGALSLWRLGDSHWGWAALALAIAALILAGGFLVSFWPRPGPTDGRRDA